MKTRSAFLFALLVLATGCTDMKDQARFEPLESSAFFKNQQSARPLLERTVARGFLREDDAMYRGLAADGSFVQTLPVEVNAKLLARGQERFNIFCSPCHSRTGNGRGMIVQRGYKEPTSFHDARLRATAPGYYFDVITNGFGVMSSYASQVPPDDRWAIVAYIRALQLSQHTDVTLIAPYIRSRLEAGEVVDPAMSVEEAHDEHDGH